MNTRDVFSYSFSAIRLRKLRAGLTTLGVIIGIAAIVALLSLAQGFQSTITAQFEKGFATNTLIVSPRSFGTTDSSFPLYVNDSQTIDAIVNVTTSVATIQKTCFVTVRGRTFMVNVMGIDFGKYKSIYASTFVAANGTIPSNPDNESVIIGAGIREPWQNRTTIADVNDRIEINWTKRAGQSLPTNVTYTGQISAVLDKIGGFGFGGPSDFGVYIPISQAQRFFETDQVNSIVALLQNSDNATITGVSNAIKSAFGNQVSVTSPTAVLDIISGVFSTVELLLAGIAGISLLVAGIGIMNIMIVSLMERTREIGILKALGMKSGTVLMIFLSEAMIIGLMGGAIGIASGWGLANIFARFGLGLVGGNLQQGEGQGNRAAITMRMEITPVLTPTVLVGALAFGLLVSVIFGLYPAWRASKLKPVEALRYE